MLKGSTLYIPVPVATQPGRKATPKPGRDWPRFAPGSAGRYAVTLLTHLMFVDKGNVMARPRKDKSQVGKPLAFRIPVHEYERFEEKVKASGLTRSEFFRRAIIDDETTIVAVPVETEDDRRELFLVNKASNNLNQLAYVMNYARMTGAIDRKLCIELVTEFSLIRQYLKVSR